MCAMTPINTRTHSHAVYPCHQLNECVHKLSERHTEFKSIQICPEDKKEHTDVQADAQLRCESHRQRTVSSSTAHTHLYTQTHTHVAQAGISNQLILMLRYCRLYIINMGACSDNWSSGAGLLPGRNGMILFFGSFCPPSIGNLSSICIQRRKRKAKFQIIKVIKLQICLLSGSRQIDQRQSHAFKLWWNFIHRTAPLQLTHSYVPAPCRRHQSLLDITHPKTTFVNGLNRKDTAGYMGISSQLSLSDCMQHSSVHNS